jgi:hypothetical protein
MRVDPTTPAFRAVTHREPAPAPVARPARPQAAAEAGIRLDIGVPASPPPEVLYRVHEAAARAAELASHNRELHFEKDPGSNRVIVEVRDLQGRHIRTIPPSSALEALNPGIWR